jgi:two-component system, NtrC family, response regulator HydG
MKAKIRAKGKILVVDDDAAHRKMLEAVLGGEGFDVRHAENGEAAVSSAENEFYDLVLMDIRMKGMGGIEALKKIKGTTRGIPIVIMTAYASVDTAVDALKSGAYDYLVKPLDIDELKIAIAKALDHYRLEKENLLLKERLGKRFDFSNIVGRSEPLMKIFETISLVAPSDAAVLILGESGTGKELFANAIHQNSLRKNGPFVKINCAAIPETLLESELFGHEKGAFTGAVKKKPGKFQQAHAGSIFLDEIAEMNAATQAKILRVLQEQEFEPVGGVQTVKVDIRVIAATNRDLRERIKEGAFREDLYYRLNVVSVAIPPLRERREDVMPLADFFLKKYARKNRRLIKGFKSETADILKKYDWPGNVRELENAVERSVILARGEAIAPDDLPDSIREARIAPSGEPVDTSPVKSLKDVEKEMILRALEETGGNRTRAADILGISRRTLQLKLKAYGVN